MNEQIEKFLRQLEEEKRLKTENETKTLSGQAKLRMKIVAGFYTTLLSIWQIIRTITFPFWWILKTIFNVSVKWYKPIWRKYAYKGNMFSKLRASGVLAITVIVLWFVYGLMFFMFDVGLYMATARVNEVVYLSNAQEINSVDNVHSVQGCEVEAENETFTCSESKSLYFRIQANMFAEVWSILHDGSFFFPDYTAAAIAPGWERCVITSYGFRMKLFLRGLEVYPYLLSATCSK